MSLLQWYREHRYWTEFWGGFVLGFTAGGFTMLKLLGH